jgi:hypothetical protein
MSTRFCRHMRCCSGLRDSTWKRYSCTHNNVYQHNRVDHSSICPPTCPACARYSRSGIAPALTEEEEGRFRELERINFGASPEAKRPRVSRNVLLRVVDVANSLVDMSTVG